MDEKLWIQLGARSNDEDIDRLGSAQLRRDDRGSPCITGPHNDDVTFIQSGLWVYCVTFDGVTTTPTVASTSRRKGTVMARPGSRSASTTKRFRCPRAVRSKRCFSIRVSIVAASEHPEAVRRVEAFAGR